MLVDDKQAREKMMEQCSDLLVISLRATAKHLRIAYSNLESDADNIIKGVDRIESLSAQVAELKKVLSIACPDDIEEACDECAPGPCVGCWVEDARLLLAAKESGP